MQAVTPVDILLVEDNPNDAELAMRAVRRAVKGARLEHVDDGVRAIEYLTATGEFAHRAGAQLPRLVLLDLKLPKLDGLEVLKFLRADARFADLPIVLFSSSKEERDVVDAYRYRVNSYVVKPVNFEQFVQTVSQISGYWLSLNQTAGDF